LGFPSRFVALCEEVAQGPPELVISIVDTFRKTVTAWEPPNVMGLSIDRTNLPGRHWLNFEDAKYELHQDSGTTILSRTTTITSNLYPAWYWRPFERWGVASEHQYIFGDLVRRLMSASSQ